MKIEKMLVSVIFQCLKPFSVDGIFNEKTAFKEFEEICEQISKE